MLQQEHAPHGTPPLYSAVILEANFSPDATRSLSLSRARALSLYISLSLYLSGSLTDSLSLSWCRMLQYHPSFYDDVFSCLFLSSHEQAQQPDTGGSAGSGAFLPLSAC